MGKVIYSTIKFKDGTVKHNVKTCDEAPEIPGFIAIWIDEKKIFYYNLNEISHLVMHEQFLERW